MELLNKRIQVVELYFIDAFHQCVDMVGALEDLSFQGAVLPVEKYLPVNALIWFLHAGKQVFLDDLLLKHVQHVPQLRIFMLDGAYDVAGHCLHYIMVQQFLKQPAPVHLIAVLFFDQRKHLPNLCNKKGMLADSSPLMHKVCGPAAHVVQLSHSHQVIVQSHGILHNNSTILFPVLQAGKLYNTGSSLQAYRR